jgi:hypothetical protein
MAARRFSVALLTLMALAGCGHKARPGVAADLAAAKSTTIGVNAYLWKAALQTLAFMPITQADSNGGVIVTDWYANPAVPTERMKVVVTILDPELRADALHVTASKEVNQNGSWVTADVPAATTQQLESIILEKARDIRRSTIAGRPAKG